MAFTSDTPTAPWAPLQHDVLDTLLDGVVSISEDATILTFNRAAEQMFGYRRDEAVGRNVMILMPEPFRSSHDGYIQRYLATGEARIIGIGRKVVGRRRNGEVFPMSLAINEGASQGRRIFTATVRDLTTDERAEARLRESFMLLFERSAEPMALLDGRGTILDANARMCELLGAEKPQLLRTRVEAFLEGGREENLRRRAMRDELGAVNSSARIQTVDGRELRIHYWEVGFVAESGEQRVLIGARDTSAERDLVRLGAILKELFETSPEGHLVTDEHERTLFFNRAHLELWGLTEADMVSRFPERWEQTRTRINEPDRLWAFRSAAVDQPGVALSETLSLVDGRVIDLRMFPLRGAMGESVGRILLTQDVTERRLAEDAQRRIRTAQAYRSLAAGVAHKLNNSLTTIVGNAFLAGRAAELHPAAAMSLDEITRAAADSAGFVRDLRALSGGDQRTPVALAVGTEVTAVVDLLAPTERARVELSVGGVLPHAALDSSSFREAVSHILRNALEAGRQVGIRVNWVDEFLPNNAATYAPTTPPRGGFLVVEVVDDGPRHLGSFGRAIVRAFCQH